jgi:hypothetical protein
MMQRRITDAEYAAALVAGQVAVEKEVRVQAVRYVPDRDAIEIVTTRNAGFLIRRAWIGALQDVPTENLARLKIWPDGSAIELEPRYPDQRAWLDDCSSSRDTAACRRSDLRKPRRQSDFGRKAKQRPDQRPERRTTTKGSKDRGSLNTVERRNYSVGRSRPSRSQRGDHQPDHPPKSEREEQRRDQLSSQPDPLGDPTSKAPGGLRSAVDSGSGAIQAKQVPAGDVCKPR